MFYYLNNQIKGLIELVFPKLCVACQNRLLNNEYLVCLSCQFTLPKTNFCLQKENTVTQIFKGKIKIEHASSLYFFTKKAKVQKLLHNFKYKGRQNIGVWLGKQMGVELKKSDFYQDIDFIVPVPLHKVKLKKRGFNQSLCFANGLSETLDVPANNNVIVRTLNSQTQTRKTRQERWDNVKDIFDITPIAMTLTNKHFLLVDDVITTGSTLEACAKTLLKIDGAKVSIATIAYAEM